MRFDGGGILGRVLRPHGHMAEPEPPQQGADAALGQMDAKAGLDHLRQVDPAPADDAVLGQIGTGADQRRQLGLMLRRQAGPGARRLAIRQPGQALLVEAMDPVAQGLTVHAAGLRRFGTAATLHHQRERQHPPCRVRILAARGRPTKACRVVLCPRDRNRHPCPMQIASAQGITDTPAAKAASQRPMPLV